MEILELKNTIIEIKNSADSFNIRLDTNEERISEVENDTKILQHNMVVKYLLCARYCTHWGYRSEEKGHSPCYYGTDI